MDAVDRACCRFLAATADGGRLLVGFSGGLDSTVLLHALAQVRRAQMRRAQMRGMEGGLVALHIDHGLVDASAAWAERCAAFAAEHRVPFQRVGVTVAAGPNLEARARRARYAAFAEALRPGDVLALAHHRDDADESLLLHLLQGRGLFGMPRERALGAGRLVRPLLEVPRAELAAYAKVHGLTWIEDPTNLDSGPDRNFLRRVVLPPLRDRFPGLSARLDRVSGHTASTGAALVEVLELQRDALPVALLDGLSSAAAVSVVRHWLICHESAAGVSDAAIRAFLEQLGSARDRQPCLALTDGAVRRHRGELHIVPPGPMLEATYELTVPGMLALPHGRLSVATTGEGLALPDPAPPLVVTFLDRLEADARLRVAGHRRRPRELVRAAGVPPWQRDTLPVLRDAAGVLAIAGVAARDAGRTAAPTLRLNWEALRGQARD